MFNLYKAEALLLLDVFVVEICLHLVCQEREARPILLKAVHNVVKSRLLDHDFLRLAFTLLPE